MKNKISSRYPLLAHSSLRGSTAAGDGDGDAKCFRCDHRPAIDEIVREQSLVTQLRAVVLPALETKADERAELVAQLFGSILDCSRKVISALRSHYVVGESPPPEAADVVDKRRAKRKNSEHSKKGDDDQAKAKSHEQKRSRRYTNSTSQVTPVPHYDGHQWRKYGQKNINNSKHQRSYYRCTYKHEQNCKATKTVQQLDGAGTETIMYTVVYYGQHTCKTNLSSSNASPHVVETSTPQSISSACSDPGDYYSHKLESMHTPELAEVCSELGSSCHALEVGHSALGLEDEDMHKQLIETFACGSLDLDSWEIDAIVRSGFFC
ncbi:WRKY DNA-binding transcription factor 70-like [Oryza brachyantha]|uniref:WRKY domain-containing protein n=1 Tax=Oryza brachyantha TaxID=4533 RepID=J3M550_ORYBR|nr:WRKY DNA-binding transcription factor 70-like [Oryza brachyantha]